MRRTQLTSWVTHERLDDEVILINLQTGAYYALDGAAADCWSLVAADATPAEMVSALGARYGVATELVEPDVVAFLAALVEHGLGTETDDPAPADHDRSPLAAAGPLSPYVTPSLVRYDDLDDLILLDPIHDVDDAGWPISRAE